MWTTREKKASQCKSTSLNWTLLWVTCQRLSDEPHRMCLRIICLRESWDCSTCYCILHFHVTQEWMTGILQSTKSPYQTNSQMNVLILIKFSLFKLTCCLSVPVPLRTKPKCAPLLFSSRYCNSFSYMLFFLKTIFLNKPGCHLTILIHLESMREVGIDLEEEVKIRGICHWWSLYWVSRYDEAALL